MNHTFVIKVCTETNSILTINPEKAHELGISMKKRAYISFGSSRNYVTVQLSEDVPDNELYLSEPLMQALHIPDYPVYEVCVRNHEIVIGPCIGMLISTDHNQLTEKRLNKLLVLTREYTKLHGALFVFALNQVDMTNRTITGYCFNPREGKWQNGTFPYPSAIYRTIGLSDAWKDHFLSILGDKLFNNHYFNKWEMYQYFCTNQAIKPHLPETILYQSNRSITDMLAKYNKIIVKPVSGLKGHGVVQISKENKGLIIRFREKGKNQNLTFDHITEANSFIAEHFREGKSLVQECIDLLTYKGSIVDFRCAISKDQANRWVCQGIFGRCGDAGSIVSNISSGGTAFSGNDLLKRTLQLSDREALLMKNRLEAFAIKVCCALEECGLNCGILGLDLGIDTKGHIWLIEINNRDPSPQFARDIHNEQLYLTIKFSPLYYAKYLAGFGISR